MAHREDLVNIDLQTGGIFRSFRNIPVGEGDVKGDRFGVAVYRNGEPVNLLGMTVVGYFIRPDGQSVVLEGWRAGQDGNMAIVKLTESCYVVPGNFKLSIKILLDGETMTARIVDGTVVDTVEGSIIDTGDVIPDLSDWTALIESLEAAAEVVEGITVTETQITGTRYKIELAFAD